VVEEAAVEQDDEGSGALVDVGQSSAVGERCVLKSTHDT
jgi:hypothetical protein